jgi:hypothetical protein
MWLACKAMDCLQEAGAAARWIARHSGAERRPALAAAKQCTTGACTVCNSKPALPHNKTQAKYSLVGWLGVADCDRCQSPLPIPAQNCLSTQSTSAASQAQHRFSERLQKHMQFVLHL